MTQGPTNPGDDEFTLDDLIEHEKRQMRWVLIVLVLAVAFFAAKSAGLIPEGVGPAQPGGTTNSESGE